MTNQLPAQSRESEIAFRNSREVLNEVFQESHSKYESHFRPNDYFEIFVSELILRSRGLSRTQLLNGRLGGGGDGGVDTCYIFVDDELVTEYNMMEMTNSNTVRQIDLYFIQTKHSERWDANAIHKLNPFARDLLDTKIPLPETNLTYNCNVLRACTRFRALYDAHSSNGPTINLRFFYASKGRNVAANFEHWRKDFCTYVGGLGNGYKCTLDCLGASDLVELSLQPVSRDYCLHIESQPLHTWDNKSYIVLANLREFAHFMSDRDGKLDPTLFEANVRDWEGKNKVNLQIRKSLEDDPVEEFWWLNNGVTILAAGANYSGSYLQLNNPEIVNGLQTSRTIHEYFSEQRNSLDENRRLLVRVIVLSERDENDSRREVIRATNSHTAVRDAEIRSLDPIHYRIEKVLNGYDPPLHYERRKKYYKNLRPRVPASQIISIARLTQSVIAALLCNPDDAKTRPGDYLQHDNQEKYEYVFNPEYPLEVYYYCAMLYKKVDKFMKSDERYTAPRRNTRLSLRYHVVTHLALMYGDPKRDQLKKRASRLAKLDVAEIKDFHIADSVSIVIQLYGIIRKRRVKFPWKDFESELLAGIDYNISRTLTTERDSVSHNDQASS